MSGQLPLVLAVLILIAIAIVVVWYFSRRRRTEQLQQHFGPEYQRTVQSTGDAGRAERELEARRQRVAQLHISELAPDQRNRFANDWQAVQTRFVDDPGGAVGDADALIQQVMQARGYPVSDFEQRAADISVDHPAVVEHYRAAHDVAQRQAAGQATTEELRRAMVDYRALFNDLLGTAAAQTADPGRRPIRQGEQAR